MITTPFALHRPHSLTDAIELLNALGDRATVYAGGTELVPLMKMGLARFDHLIDLKRIAQLRTIERVGEVIRIGAGVTHHEIEQNALLAQFIPSLPRVAAGIGNIRVRVTGTLGGNLCFAEPRSDPLALLSALEASVNLAGATGQRQVPVSEFVTGSYSTTRREGEVLVSVDVPTGASVAYRKLAFAERPTAAVACALRTEGKSGLTLVVGSVGPIPFRFQTASGIPGEERTVDALAARVSDECNAVADEYGGEDYKRHVVNVLVKRALSDLGGSTNGR